MYLVGIDDTIPSDIRDTFVRRLGDQGRLAVVRSDDQFHRDSTAEVEASFATDGNWQLTASNGSLSELLDELAPRADYAVFLDTTFEKFPRLEANDGDIVLNSRSKTATFDTDDIPSLLTSLEQTEPWKSLESLIVEVKASSEVEQSGAIATFTGRVRTKDGPNDTATKHLEFEAYGDVAIERIRRIEREISSRPGVFEVAMHHRTGKITAGEDIVFVVVLAGHRDEAFTAVEDGINRLKAEVPIFKKEVTVDEEFWVHTRP